jgi:hypothetical protein
MPKICYTEWTPAASSQATLDAANTIIEQYQAKGYDLTLRQLYYQLVARDIIANTQAQYDRLGIIISKARLAGLVDWNAIVDRTRNMKQNSHWDNPGQIIRACANQFMVDRWAGQDYRVEVWIEKDALVGVISRVCEQLDVPYFSCRGYTSASEMWSMGHRRMGQHRREGQTTIIMHLGDHDPSGLDMTRDIADRLELFSGQAVEVKRLALNMDQVEELGPPPNPAKVTDSRAKAYIIAYGRESWELDALEPEYMENLIRTNVLALRDQEAWDKALEKEGAMVAKLKELAQEYGHDEW